MSVFAVILFRIFPYSDQNNTKYGHCLRGEYIGTFNPYFTNIQIYCHAFQYCKAFAGQSWKASIKKEVPWCIVYHNRTSLYNTVCTKLRAGLNPARGVSELCDGENLLQ